MTNPIELLLLPALFFIEYLGVETGFPFGVYSYNSDLFLLLGVPIFIPLAWFVLIKGTYLGLRQIFLSAFFILMFDIVLELFAVKNGMWLWDNAKSGLFPAPIINYISWFVISILVALFINTFRTDSKTDRFYSGLTLIAIMHYISSSLSGTPGELIGLIVIILFIGISLVNAIKEV